MVRNDFAEQNAPQHIALISSLTEAADWCAKPSHRSALAQLMSREVFPTLSAQLIEQSLMSKYAPIFKGTELHRPTPAQASWLVGEMLRQGQLNTSNLAESTAHQAFRADIYDRANPPKIQTQKS
jgi:ABC-type nitrate/sulfonate/bicarbonate transport system substrate-binding protein